MGERIRARRQRQGLTLKDLAAKTKLSLPYLSDIERRQEVNPTLEKLELIANALKTSVPELLGGAMFSNERALPLSLQRYVNGEDFTKRVERLAKKAGRDTEEMKQDVINFLVTAPKRATGDLSVQDWRRLLDFYSVILEE